MAFSSLNGDIDVTFPADLKANVSLRTDNGEVYSDFDVKVQPTAPQQTVEDNRGKGGKYRVKIDKNVRGTINGGGQESSSRILTATSTSGRPAQNSKTFPEHLAGYDVLWGCNRLCFPYDKCDRCVPAFLIVLENFFLEPHCVPGTRVRLQSSGIEGRRLHRTFLEGFTVP